MALKETTIGNVIDFPTTGEGSLRLSILAKTDVVASMTSAQAREVLKGLGFQGSGGNFGLRKNQQGDEITESWVDYLNTLSNKAGNSR